MNRSIIDIENAILNVLEDTSGIIRFVESITLNENVTIINYNDENLKKELYREMVSFKDNNLGTLDKLIVFYNLNQSLRDEIRAELKSLER